MMYIHYCEYCKRIYMLNGHKRNCNACENEITELNISYLEYVNMNKDQRERLIEKLSDNNVLKELDAKYRMYKYTKWYKELKKDNVEEKAEKNAKKISTKYNIELIFGKQNYSIECVETSGKWEISIIGFETNISIANPKRDFINAEKIDNVLKNYGVSSAIATKIKEEFCAVCR